MERLVQAAKVGDINELNTLLEEDPKILQKFTLLPKKDTPLHIAASVGNLQFVRKIIDRKPSFAWDENKYGLTPLHIASALGHSEIVDALLKLGSASLCRLQDNEGRTPLHYAAINGETTVLRWLVSECPETLEIETSDNETPLHLALKNKKSDVIKALVEDLGCYKMSIFQGRFSIKRLAKETDQRQVFRSENKGCLGRLLLDSLPLPNLASRTDQKTSQVIATLIATMTFQAAVRPPATIWKQGMRLNYSCIIPKQSAIDLFHCPTLNYLLFLLSNSAGFFFSSLLLLTLREGIVAEILLRASLLCLVFSYVILLISMSLDDYSGGSIGVFLFILVYAVLITDWLRMKIALWVKRTPLNQAPNPSDMNTSDTGDEQPSLPETAPPESTVTTWTHWLRMKIALWVKRPPLSQVPNPSDMNTSDTGNEQPSLPETAPPESTV